MSDPTVSEKIYLKLLLIPIFLWCLFSFKWSIAPSVTGGSSLRVDDFLLLLVLVIWFSIIVVRGKINYVSPLFFMCLFVAWSVVSSAWNSSIGRIEFMQGMLYSLRSLEYIAFFFVGYILSKTNISLVKVFLAYLVYVIIIHVGQKFGLVGVVSKFTIDRAVANTGGPYELAVVMSFVALYFLSKTNRNIFAAVASMFMIYLTHSRITSVAFIVVYLKQHAKLLLFAILLLPFSVVVYMYSNDALYTPVFVQRLEVLFTDQFFDDLAWAVNEFGAVKTREAYIEVTYGSDSLYALMSVESDPSAIIRFSRWLVLLSTVFSSIDSIFVGLGPSFASLAVDGNYVRLVTETGIIGLVLYIAFLVSVIRTYADKSYLVNYVYVLCLTALFIDIFVSYKAMMLLWLMLGYEHGGARASKIDVIRVSDKLSKA